MEFAEREEEVFAFFKALADANRLKIVGLLAREAHTVDQIATILDLRPSSVSHHLALLIKADLVTERRNNESHVYELQTENLESKARRLLAQAPFPLLPPNMDLDSYDRKVVRDFSTPEGRIKVIPVKRKKMLAILRHVVRAFEPGIRYSEQETNDILGRFNEDTARLRRELVVNGLMAREGGAGAYWRTDE